MSAPSSPPHPRRDPLTEIPASLPCSHAEISGLPPLNRRNPLRSLPSSPLQLTQTLAAEHPAAVEPYAREPPLRHRRSTSSAPLSGHRAPQEHREVEEVDAGRSQRPYSKLRTGIAHRSIAEPPRRGGSTAASSLRRFRPPHELHGVVRNLPAPFSLAPRQPSTSAPTRRSAMAAPPLRTLLEPL